MKVSIMVLTYNRSNLLKETIDSILNQTFKDFEIIIVDNYSIDDTEEVVKSYDDNRIKYFKNKNYGLLAVNRNFAIKQSSGEYIALCDDDDLWLPQKLEKQIEEFEKDEKIGIVFTNGYSFDDHGNEIKEGKSSSRYYSFEDLIMGNIITCCSVMFKKSVINDVGIFDESKEIFTGEDFEFWLRIVKKYKMKYIGIPLVKYRVHDKSLQSIYGIEGKSLNVDSEIYKKLFYKKIIDDKLYKKILLKLNYRYLTNKLLNNNSIKLNTIIHTNMIIHERFSLLIIYFLFVTGILNILQNKITLKTIKR